MTYEDDLRDELRLKRRLLHLPLVQEARGGIYVDPSVIIAAEDLDREVRQLEAQLRIERPQVAPRRRYEEPPMPEQAFQERVVGQQTRARQADIDHHFTLLNTHRANLAHYRAQAKAFGGIELALPITRHGMNEARAGITQAKRALGQLGVAVDNLPGDE